MGTLKIVDQPTIQDQ